MTAQLKPIAETASEPAARPPKPSILVASKGQHARLSEVSQIFKQKYPTRFCPFESTQDLKQNIARLKCGVILYSVQNREELLNLIKMQVSLSSYYTQGTLRIMVLTRLQTTKVLKVLKEHWVSEVVDTSTKARALDFKVQRHLKLIEKAIHEKSRRKNRASNQKDTGKELRSRKKFDVQIVSPLKSEADCWLIQRKEDARRVLGKWMIDVVGPGPSVGIWNESNINLKLKEKCWEWTGRHQIRFEEFVRGSGKWIFSGKKPDFQNLKWSFISSNPILVYLGDGEEEIKRFYLGDENTLLMAGNSNYAIQLLPQIKSTYESQIRIKKEEKKKNGEQFLEKQTGNRSSEMNFLDINDPKGGTGLSGNFTQNSHGGSGFQDIQFDKNTAGGLEGQIDAPNAGTGENFIEREKGHEDSGSNPFGEIDLARPGELNGIFESDKKKQHSPEERQKNRKAFDHFNESSEKSDRENPNLFNRIDEEKHKVSRGLESKDAQSPVIIWVAKQALKIASRIENFSDSQQTVSIGPPLSGSFTEFFNRAKELNLDRIFFNFSLHRGSVFFFLERDSINNINEQRLEINFPASLYEVQRRAHFRLPCYPYRQEYLLISEIGRPSRILDISAGGAAFWIEKECDSIFTPDQVIRGLRYKFYDRKLECDARIAWKREMTLEDPSGKQDGIAVGLQFQNLDSHITKELDLYVFEESSEYISKYWIS